MSAATRSIQKSPFYDSFRRQASTKWREGCAVELKIRVSSQFWTSDEHETTKGLREDPGKFACHHSFGRPTSTKRREGCVRDLENLHFTTVLDVRQARSDERVVSTKPTQRKKKKEIFQDAFIQSHSQHSHSQQPLLAALPAATLSSSSQQPLSAALFSAALLSSHSQQLFSAAILSSHSRQLFSPAIFSSHSHQPLSAALLTSHSQQPLSAALLSRSAILIMLLWSGVGGQLFSSCCCGQGLVVSYSHHVAVVRGWWWAILIMLLWSGVGGQLFSSCCCGQGLVVSYSHHVAVVRGWWWYILIMLLWSGVGGELFILTMLAVNCAHVLQKNPFAELSGNAQISPDAHPYLQNCIKVEKSLIIFIFIPLFLKDMYTFSFDFSLSTQRCLTSNVFMKNLWASKSV